MVIADGKVLNVELDALVKASVTLKLKGTDGRNLNEHQIRAWFLENKGAITKEYFGHDGQLKLNRLIMDLQNYSKINTLLKAMYDIGYADNELHAKENMVIELAEAFWGNLLQTTSKSSVA